MAFVHSMVLFASLFCLGFEFTSACDPTKCSSYFDEKKLAGKTATQACGVLVSAFNCVRSMKQDCPANVYSQIINNFKENGMDINSDVESDCCNQIGELDGKCDYSRITEEKNFVPSNGSCKKEEDTWTCSKPYLEHIASKCKITLFAKDGVKEGRTALAGHLDQCKAKGFNVTVDYPGAGNRAVGVMQSHPVVTFVALASTLVFGLRGFQF